jgi:CheY-like chemotaxis protein
MSIDEAYTKAHPEARPGHFVCLTVSDTGCGRDPKTMERIFEPFFSTKEVGKGTGLGLATVYGIVKQHQGWIEVNSQVGVGATFQIFFPSASRPVDAAVQPQDEAVSPRGRETILVVEDEPVVRDFVCEVLKGLDYSVVEAGCGAEALRAWDEFDGQIDLLLTDMVMPQGMTGRELVQHLKKRKPELKVVYTSGYSPEALQEDFSQTETVFLSKPYLPPQLAKIVRTTLDNPSKTQRELVAQA